MAGLVLIAAIVICWNSDHPGEVVTQRQHAGLKVESVLLAYISLLDALAWSRTLLTGEYRWPKRR